MVLTVGTVLNNYDKEQPGKIMVTMGFNDSQGNKSAWLPVMTPYGGGGYGQYFLPEVGDAVVVGFINDDPQTAFVLGSYWNKKNKLPQNCANQNNELKKITTKGGHQLTFDDKEKGGITISTNKGQKIVFDEDAESITVSGKDGKNSVKIDNKAGKVTIAADKSISIKSDSTDIKLETVKLELKGKTVTIEAETTLTLKGKTLKLDAPSMNLDGQNLQAKGAMITLDASGVLTLKGGLAKIN